jgi:CRISPR-associated endonuclease Cas1
VSPLFSNIYLHTLDEFALHKGFKYIRYSDNFIIVDENRDRMYIAYEQVNAFVENQLLLKLNENPYPFKDIKKGFVFLGIFFKEDVRRISHAKETKIFRKLNYYTEIRHQRDIEKCIERLNAGIDGKKRYYGFIQPLNQFEAFDQHLIKRLGYLLKYFVQKGMPSGKDDLEKLLMKLVFFVDRSPSDIRSLCQRLANDAFAGTPPDNKKKAVKPQTAQSKKAAAQKNRYLKQVSSQTEVQISTPGTFIGKTSARITVRQNRKNILEVPFSKIKHISIHTSGVSLSSDLVFQCSKSRIPITFYSFKGHPIAVLQSPVHSMGSLSIQQIKTYETERSLELTKRILKGKATNQLNLLKYYRRSRKSESNAFAAAVENAIGKTRQILTDMQSIEFNIPYSVTRDRLFSGEARISVYYWGGMKLLIQPELGFEKRVRFKAGDLVNNMLNYGYGILYQRVWQSIQKQGLNPHISFLHAFQAGKPTLVYDMVEEFRQPFADRAVFSLLTKGKKGADLNIDPKTGLLNKKTRDLVVKAVLERLSSLINYRGEKKKCETIIELQMKNLVLFLKGEKIYKPFISGY